MGLPRDIVMTGSSLGSRLYRFSRSLRWVAITCGFIGDARSVKVVERHPRSRRAKGVAIEIETVHLSAILLIGQSLRRGHRIARVEDVGEVVGRFLLFRPLHWSFLGGLCLCDSVAGLLRSRALGDGKAENTQDQTSNRQDYF